MITSCLIVESKIVEKRVYPLYARLTIGRKFINDISLPDRTVSKQHAVVGRVKGKIVVKDLGSRNGTFVNGENNRESRACKQRQTQGRRHKP